MFLSYDVRFHIEPDGVTAIVPSLPGCITCGDTLEQANEMVKEAIELYIEELRANGQPIPDDSNTFTRSVQVVTA